MRITAAGNTEIPAILVLESRGYTISTSSDRYWYAEKSNCKYTAQSPLELLGLIELHIARGIDWKADDSDIDRCIKQYSGLSEI